MRVRSSKKRVSSVDRYSFRMKLTTGFRPTLNVSGVGKPMGWQSQIQSVSMLGVRCYCGVRKKN